METIRNLKSTDEQLEKAKQKLSRRNIGVIAVTSGDGAAHRLAELLEIPAVVQKTDYPEALAQVGEGIATILPTQTPEDDLVQHNGIPNYSNMEAIRNSPHATLASVNLAAEAGLTTLAIVAERQY